MKSKTVIKDMLYSWEGNDVFDTLGVKKHPSGWRYAANFTIGGTKRTFILITEKRNDDRVSSLFTDAASQIQDDENKLDQFKRQAGDSPISMSIMYQG